MKLLFSEVSFYLYKSAIHPYMDYCCHAVSRDSSEPPSYLDPPLPPPPFPGTPLTPLSLTILFYIFNIFIIDMVDIHISICFCYYYWPLLIYTINNICYNKMIIITTISKVIYENGCYFICVVPILY